MLERFNACAACGNSCIRRKKIHKKTIDLIKQERDYLYNSLCDMKIKVYSSDTNFLLFFSKLPLSKLLKNERIAIRSCDNFIGLNENYFRIAVKNHSENVILINALKKILNESGESN
ncbi:MAG: aminotransferase class I/II-fold pyridoxal phosphate-dependent enzyme [Oscillospiraceae bacterium]|nr:aminotransferase class I/II-fold pyridoxal phosphate-dependent enzyme [Oscillospiraceae bacterium]